MADRLGRVDGEVSRRPAEVSDAGQPLREPMGTRNVPVTDPPMAPARQGTSGSLPFVSTWDAEAHGTLSLPSGRLVRGRGLRRPQFDGSLPEFGVYLLDQRPKPVSWEARWVRWKDFRLPADRRDAHDALREAWRRAAGERVEVACREGRGRTGTALACLAVLDGVPPGEAIAYVRERYDPGAVETPWQRRYVIRFATS